MSKDRPFIITLIGDGCILSAILSILSLFKEFTEIEPLPNYLNIPLSNYILQILIAIIFLIVSYGYLRIKRWGYWLILGINLYFLVGWIISYKQIPILIIIELIFILPTIKYFR